MPKDTFFNLKEEKQQRILTAALQEIAASGYDKASVTRIVKDAGIATGSFYQYFEDLDDLFVYVSLEAGKLKTTYIRKAMEEIAVSNLESCIRALYLGGMRFALEHPEYHRCAQSVLRIKDTPLFAKMTAAAEKSELVGWLFRFLGEAIANGELHEGITPELFFRLLTNVNTTIIEYLMAQSPDGSMTQDAMETLCTLGVQMMMHGISKPPAQPDTHSDSKGD